MAAPRGHIQILAPHDETPRARLFSNFSRAIERKVRCGREKRTPDCTGQKNKQTQVRSVQFIMDSLLCGQKFKGILQRAVARQEFAMSLTKSIKYISACLSNGDITQKERRGSLDSRGQAWTVLDTECNLECDFFRQHVRVRMVKH